MDGLEFNKIAAAILIALLTVKGADLISQALIHSTVLKEPAYKIEGVVGIIPPAGLQAEKKGPSPIEPLLATANLERGAEVFKKCTSCHTIDKGAGNRIGPNLYDVIGSEKGKHPPDYSFSAAMENKGGTWTYDDLNKFLYNPRGFVSGTKMSFVGVKDDKDRAALIAYLRSHSDTPFPLPVGQTQKTPASSGELSKPVVLEH